ncbi:MAG: hypothetical protein PQJ49_08125 [Sphaerochaetaceae bacterium]|nr:hypothetical protein [Sphaerochaetaceae bacterium]
MITETDNKDFDFDFGGGGEIASLESFLEDDDIQPPTNTDDLDLSGGDDTPDVDKPDVDKPDIDLEGDDDKDKDKDKKKPEGSFDIDLTGGDDDDNPPITSNLNYKNVIQKLVDEKLWDGIDAFETEDGEVAFEDMDIDEETFVEIFKQKLEENNSSLTANKISTDKVSDFTKKLIEIESNGGNVQQALASYQAYKSPLEGLDFSKESDQQAAIYLKYQAKGLEDKDIVELIKTYESNGELEAKAVEAKTEVEAAFNKQMEAINQQAIDNKERQKEALKQYRDTLSNSLKEFELTDSYRKKILDVASKQDDNGKFELDTIYSQMRQDPEKSAELVLFLTNKEEYIKQITEQAKRENQLDTMRKIKLINKGKSSVKIDPKKNKNSDKNFVDINDI